MLLVVLHVPAFEIEESGAMEEKHRQHRQNP
jgi:hypothetical protein